LTKHVILLIKLIAVLSVVLVIVGCSAKGIINLQSGNALASQKWLSKEQSFKLPFVWHDGHIIIEIDVNDTESLRLAFDSAASATVIFETPRTQTLQLDVERQLEVQSSQVNVVNNGIIRVGDIELSELTFIHVPIEKNPLFHDYDTAYFDGAIGYDLLNHFNVSVLYAEQSLQFHKKSAKSEFNHENSTTLPLSVHGRIPYVNARLKDNDGVEADYAFIIDTGAPDYVYLNEKLTDKLEFPNDYFETHTQNFDGKQVVETSRIDFFGLGDSEFENVAAHNLLSFEDPYGIGLIGSGLLRKFNVHFNYQDESITLVKNKFFSHKTDIDRSGLVMEPHRLGGVIKQVAKNSHAAELGFTEQAIVKEINGKAITEDNFDELRRLFRSDAQSVNVCWQTNGGTKCGDLKLEDRIAL